MKYFFKVLNIIPERQQVLNKCLISHIIELCFYIVYVYILYRS